jgi:hypothetical protein
MYARVRFVIFSGFPESGYDTFFDFHSGGYLIVKSKSLCLSLLQRETSPPREKWEDDGAGQPSPVTPSE